MKYFNKVSGQFSESFTTLTMMFHVLFLILFDLLSTVRNFGVVYIQSGINFKQISTSYNIALKKLFRVSRFILATILFLINAMTF